MSREKLPRVLQILPSFSECGGVERGTRDIAEAFLDHGCTPFVASAGGNLVPEFVQRGGVHIDLPLNSKNPLTIVQNIGQLQRAAEEHRIDIFHVRSRAPAWSTLVASQTLNIPFVTTYHAPYNAKFFLKKTYNAVMAKGTHVIAISDFIAQHVHKQYGTKKWFHKNHLSVIPRGIDTHFFNPDRISAQDLELLYKKYNLPSQRQIILLPGRLTRWKGQKVLIQALSKLRMPDVHVVFVGSSQGREAYFRELQKEVLEYGLATQVHFIPHTKEIPSLYAISTLVVSASTDPEGFGRVIAEAGAMKRPVIATDHGAAPEIVLEGKTGWLFPLFDVLALQDCLKKALLMSKEQHQCIGETARQNILTHFSQDVFCEKTLDIYKKIGKRSRE